MDRFEENLRQLAATHAFAFVEIPTTVERNAAAVIQHLVTVLVATGSLRAEAEQQAAQAILAREQVGSTGIGQGVSLPHATIPLGDRVVGVVAHSKAGIAWDSLDGRPVHWACLVLAPRDRPGDYLRVLQCFSQALRHAGEEPPA